MRCGGNDCDNGLPVGTRWPRVSRSCTTENSGTPHSRAMAPQQQPALTHVLQKLQLQRVLSKGPHHSVLWQQHQAARHSGAAASSSSSSITESQPHPEQPLEVQQVSACCIPNQLAALQAIQFTQLVKNTCTPAVLWFHNALKMLQKLANLLGGMRRSRATVPKSLAIGCCWVLRYQPRLTQTKPQTSSQQTITHQ